MSYTSPCEECAIANRKPVTVHPDDTKARGIAKDDLVHVWSARGQVLVGAHVSDDIKPGIICIYEDAWPDIEDGICKNGDASVLTADIPTSRLANGRAGNTSLVYAERYTNEAPRLTVFDEPAIVIM